MAKVTPEMVARAGTEHAHQTALMVQCTIHVGEIPQLALIFAVPNGGDRDLAVAGRLKAEGVKRGIPDLCWPTARGPYHGLYVEMKIPKRISELNGGLSSFQLDVMSELRIEGYCAVPAYGWEHAWKILKGYWDLGPFNAQSNMDLHASMAG